MHFVAVIVAFAFAALAGCSNKLEDRVAEQSGTINGLSHNVSALQKQLATQNGQTAVLNVQTAAADTAKSVVHENRLRQFSACKETPARLERIENYKLYAQVAQTEYQRTCREAVAVAKWKDRRTMAATAEKKQQEMAKAQLKHKKPKAVAKTS